MFTLKTVKGNQITTNHSIHICYAEDERTGRHVWPEATFDDWGDPAVVVEVTDNGDGTTTLTVAPDHTDTLETVEVDNSSSYTIIEEEKK